jgi:integrase-like protein
MGIRDKPIAPGSPWQNCFAERLIGSIRRECVDYVVALGEQHLRQVLKSYANYNNTTRNRARRGQKGTRRVVFGRTCQRTVVILAFGSIAAAFAWAASQFKSENVPVVS